MQQVSPIEEADVYKELGLEKKSKNTFSFIEMGRGYKNMNSIKWQIGIDRNRELMTSFKKTA